MNVKKLAVVYIALGLMLGTAVAEVKWSRLNGRVKGVDGKRSEIMIQNREGDLLTIKVDDDVQIVRDHATIILKDIQIDDKVTLLYIPQAPKPKDGDDQPLNGIYPPSSPKR